MGRPSEYTEEIADRICEQIADGKSLRAICKGDDFPARSTVRLWLAEHEKFSVQYVRAREEQADHYADEIIEIADTEKDAAKARNRIEARKWKASKMNRKTYGDKLSLDHSGKVEMSEEQVDARIADLLRKAGISGPAGTEGKDSGEEQA